MAHSGDVFANSGPTHLAAVDWNYGPHRRSIAATLVQAVYVLEHDRQNFRQGADALAPSWWKFFHFQLKRLLLDDADSSIFGAIFEYKPPSFGCKHNMAQDTPKYVIAFRGMIIKKDSGHRDFKLGMKTILNCLHRTSRVDIAMKIVHQFVAENGVANIWIAGHSLGSAIGMFVGKHMAKDYGVLLKTFLFNPPFTSPPLEWIKSKRVKRVIYTARILSKLGLAKVAKSLHWRSSETDDSFKMLSTWVPSLFVHNSDPICSGYTSYFEGRENMRMKGLGRIFERKARNISRTSILMNAVGKDSEPLHLLPSAVLTKNLSRPGSLKQSHGLEQWWKADLALQNKRYEA